MIQKNIEDLAPQVAELLYMINKGHDLVVNSNIHIYKGYLVASSSIDGGVSYTHYFFGRIPLPYKKKLKKFFGYNDSIYISDLLSFRNKFGEIIAENQFNVNYVDEMTVEVSKGNISIREKPDNLNLALLKLALMFQVESKAITYPQQLENLLVEFDRQCVERAENKYYDCV